jgi:glycosyltransferase involved in cell wall biosynthesis
MSAGEAPGAVPVYHVITPGDHFSPRTGSAIPTVVHGLATGAAESGDAGRYTQHVLLQRGTFEPRYASATAIEYPAADGPSRADRYLDVVRGGLGMRRRGAERAFRSAVGELAAVPAGIVVAHNAPTLPRHIEDSPHACILYAHNDLFRSYTRSEVSRVVGAADAVVCVSEFVASQLRARLPRRLHDAVRVVGNGVDTVAFRPAPEAPRDVPRVMFVGRAIPEKGADILLSALAIIDRRDVEAVIVGSYGFDRKAPLTPYERELRRIADALACPVRFEPFVDRQELPQLLQSADVLVVPSRWPEPWALTVGEGLASGLAVVAADRGGIPEALGGAGILFDPDEPAELAAALDALVQDPEARRALGADGRRSAEERDWSWAWRRLAEVLDSVATSDRQGEGTSR